MFKMPKMRKFGQFLTSLEDKLFFIKKKDMSSKMKTYDNPTHFHTNEIVVFPSGEGVIRCLEIHEYPHFQPYPARSNH